MLGFEKHAVVKKASGYSTRPAELYVTVAYCIVNRQRDAMTDHLGRTKLSRDNVIYFRTFYGTRTNIWRINHVARTRDGVPRTRPVAYNKV